MRFLPALIPLIALPVLASYLDLWRALANKATAESYDIVWSQFVSATTLLILAISFAGTVAWFVRRGWTHFTVSIVYCITGFVALFGGPVALLFLRNQALADTAVSESLVSPFNNLTSVSWGLVAALGMMLLFLEVFGAGGGKVNKA